MCIRDRYWLRPPIVYPICSPKTSLQRKLDINAKRTKMVSVPVSHGSSVPRARTGPLSNCFRPIPLHSSLKDETLLGETWMNTDWRHRFATNVATFQEPGFQAYHAQNVVRCLSKQVQNSPPRLLPSLSLQHPSVPTVASQKAHH